MKTTKIIIVLLFITLINQAQMVVESNGNVDISSVVSTIKVGGEAVTGKAVFGPKRTGDDPTNLVTASIFGPYSDMRTGGKLSFGDFGSLSNSSLNVFIGEYGTTDTDELWLHGKNGIRWTAGGTAATPICRSYYESGEYKFKFYVKAYTQSGIIVASDSRFKTNINSIDNSLSQLIKLKGVSYNLLPIEEFPEPLFPDSVVYNDSIPPNQKELRNKIEEENKKNYLDNKRLNIGFIAQDLQKVFPNLVEQDDDGYLYIDYIGLIPVIVEALKEQESIIDAQSLKIKELEKKIENLSNPSTENKKLKSSSISTEIIENEIITNAFLYQNIPNPFSSETKIEYFIPGEAKNADLYIFDMQGNMLKSNKIQSFGQGSIKILASEFQPGMYIYSLIVDGKEVDIKRMILTN